MIKALDTVVADGAVRAPRRPVELARFTVLDLHSDPIDNNFFNARHPKRRRLAINGYLPRLWFRRMGVGGNDAWISARGQEEEAQILDKEICHEQWSGRHPGWTMENSWAYRTRNPDTNIIEVWYH